MADEPKPPYVRFETRSVENREATIEAGHYVGRDVIFAIVTPAGTRDQIEREADAWLANIQEGVNQDRIPSAWYPAYKRALEDYGASRDTPEFGSSIVNWPTATPSQIKTLLDINVRTVEELAAANEETLQRLGMGGRALKQKAEIWLSSSKDQGQLVEEVAQLRIKNEELETRDAEREVRLQELEQSVKLLSEAPKAPVKEKA